MGNIKSAHCDVGEPEKDIWWNNPNMSFYKNSSATSQDHVSNPKHQHPNSAENVADISTLSDTNKEKLNEFKLELARKHEKRREIIAEKRKEFQNLRDEIQRLRTENEMLRNNPSTGEKVDDANEEFLRLQRENQALRKELQEKSEELKESEELHSKNNELRKDITLMQCELQRLNKDILEFEAERHDYQAHVVALKDVIKVSKQMLQIRESQLKELKQKVEQIEASLQGREMNILSQDLRNEYERQLQNIRNLRTLYEERQRTDKKEKQELLAKIEDMKKELERYEKKKEELEERVVELEEENSRKYDEIMSLESNLGLAKAETRQYQSELTVINQLFSEILLGFTSSQEVDLDKLTKHLEEHHDLLKNIVRNEISPGVASVLPKVLLDLVNQASNDGADEASSGKETGEENENTTENLEEQSLRDGQKLETILEESESQTSSCQLNSPQEIVELLPKVWRVLIELLSHQKAPTNNVIEDTNEDTKTGDPDACYKTVQTPKGPSLVLSVSQTFIRLKDLILEKKSLEKEMNHLKHLNTHLENRLVDQEKRLELVSSELSKTWHVVGKLQKQHQLLHTQEKILRYELAQKRKLLTTLKEELECSREKRQQAREKNSNTEREWRQLRVEFASRRNLITDDFNNSTESGYSDERASSSDDEADGPGYETDVSECTAPNTSNNNETDDTLDDTESKLEDETEDIENDVNSSTETQDLKTSTTTGPINKNDLVVTELSPTEECQESLILEEQSRKHEGSSSLSTTEDLKYNIETEVLEPQVTEETKNTLEDVIPNTKNNREDPKTTVTDQNKAGTSYTETHDLKTSTTTDPINKNYLEVTELNPTEECKESSIFEEQSRKQEGSSSLTTTEDLKYNIETEVLEPQVTEETKHTLEDVIPNTENKREDPKMTVTDPNKAGTSYVVEIYDGRQRQIVQYVQPRSLLILKSTIVPENDCRNESAKTEASSEEFSDEMTSRILFEDIGLEKNTPKNQIEVEDTVTDAAQMSNVDGDNDIGQDFNSPLFVAEDLLETRQPRKIVDHVGDLSSYIENLESSSNSAVTDNHISITVSEQEAVINGEEDCPQSSTVENSSSTRDLNSFKIDNTRILLLEENLKKLVDNAQPSTSSGLNSSKNKPNRTFEEHLVAKEERLKRLEGQCNQLVKKVTDTSNKRQTISNRLDSLHEVYGENSQSNNANDLEKSSKLVDNNETKDNNDNQE